LLLPLFVPNVLTLMLLLVIIWEVYHVTQDIIWEPELLNTLVFFAQPVQLLVN